LLVAYLFYDNARIKKAHRAQLAKIEDQIRRIENNSKLGETTLSNQITGLKTDIEDTHEAAKAELKKTAAQIQAEGRKTKQELSMALSTKADASHVEAQVQAAKSEAESKIGKVSNEVGGVKTQVTDVKNELEGTQRQLLDMRDSLSAAVARNSTELAQLRLKGERNYIEFTIPKKKAEVRVEDIRLVLTKTNHKKGKFNLKILVDDGQIEKKDRVINEPIQFLVGKNRVRYEVVVNWVQKNRIGGYVSTPKDKTLAAEGIVPDSAVR
jgi:chromosome segregation ATPase